MNNGHPIRGPEGDTEGITEHRVNTWFTNRRKGIATPSPTMVDGLVSGASSGKLLHIRKYHRCFVITNCSHFVSAISALYNCPAYSLH